MSCRGEGECLIQCICICLYCSKCKLTFEEFNEFDECECRCECDEEYECICYQHIPKEICSCGHREHMGMCKPEIPCEYDCEPVLCPNDINHKNDNKGQMYPKWLFNCHGGNCPECAILYGHGFSHKNEINECPICYENKPMISLQCKHEICWDCWSSICEKSQSDSFENRASCPICRRKKW